MKPNLPSILVERSRGLGPRNGHLWAATSRPPPEPPKGEKKTTPPAPQAAEGSGINAKSPDGAGRAVSYSDRRRVCQDRHAGNIRWTDGVDFSPPSVAFGSCVLQPLS